MDIKLIRYLKKSFLTGTFKTLIVIISTIVFIPLIIQKIGMDTYGLISLTMIFGGMVVFADFGISKSVTLLIGKEKNKNNINDIISNALFINIVILLVIALILYIFVIVLNINIFGEELKISESLKKHIILIGFLSFSIILINNLLTAILEAFYLMHYVNIGYTISSLLLNISIYSISLLTESLYILIMSPLFTFLIVTYYYLFIVRKFTKIRIVTINFLEMKKILSISYQFFNIGVLNALILPLNKYLIIYFTGNSSYLGIFDVSVKIGLLVNSFLNSISQPLFGVFSNYKMKVDEIYSICKKVSSLILVFLIIGIIFYYFIGIKITIFIDKDNYQELYTLSLILIIGLGMNAVSEPYYRSLLGKSRLKEAFYLKLLIPILNVFIYIILENDNVLINITIAYSSSVFISSLILIIYCTKYMITSNNK